MSYTIKPVLSPTKGTASAAEVPAELKTEIEELYEYFTVNPGFEAHVVFAEDGEGLSKAEFVRYTRTYAKTREAGALNFRILPSKGLPENELRFKLTADLPANGAREGGSK